MFNIKIDMSKIRLFLFLILLNLSFQSWAKADDIRDFEIEGMSIGDSLLNFFNKNEIEKNKAYFYNSKEYYAFVSTKYSSENYDGVQFHVRDNDDKFIIEAIEGMKNTSNFNECNKQQKIIVKELSSFFTNAVAESDSGSHTYDPTGDSKYTRTVFYLNPEDEWNSIEVSCFDWSKKLEKNFSDKLIVGIKSQKFQTFMAEKAYN